MARVYRSSDIIKSAKRKAMLPETQVTFLEEDFLAFANEEMDMAIIPYVLSFHEDYYQTNILIPLENNVKNYAIPYRAIGNKLRDVQYVDSSGNIETMTRVFVEDLYRFQDTGSHSAQGHYYIEDNEIILINNPNTSQGFLRVVFYLRPNSLVGEDRVSVITSIDRTTGIITVDKIPTGLFSSGVLVDIVDSKSPNKILKYDVSITSVDSGNKTITIDPLLIPVNLKVKDQISLAEETSMAQIPTELQSLLSQRVAARCLEALGDAAGLAAANAKIQEIEQKSATLIDARVEGSPMKVLPRVGLLKSVGLYNRRSSRR